jgi:tRNA(fMet)-specific endonuclease VapC
LRQILLDTTFLVDVERGRSVPDEVIDDDDDVAIAAITIAELSVGIGLASGRSRAGRQAFVDDVLATLTVIPYDESVALQHASLLVAVRRAGRPRGAHDLIIAATALAADRTVITADRAAFIDLPGVRVIDHRDG